jgi:hypothetical protein
MPDIVRELLATEAALDKLGARNISADEAGQVPRNRHVMVRNSATARDRDDRRRSRVDPGRRAHVEPTTWLIVAGWSSTDAERTS